MVKSTFAVSSPATTTTSSIRSGTTVTPSFFSTFRSYVPAGRYEILYVPSSGSTFAEDTSSPPCTARITTSISSRTTPSSTTTRPEIDPASEDETSRITGLRRKSIAFPLRTTDLRASKSSVRSRTSPATISKLPASFNPVSAPEGMKRSYRSPSTTMLALSTFSRTPVISPGSRISSPRSSVIPPVNDRRSIVTVVSPPNVSHGSFSSLLICTDETVTSTASAESTGASVRLNLNIP